MAMSSIENSEQKKYKVDMLRGKKATQNQSVKYFRKNEKAQLKSAEPVIKKED